MYARPAQSLTRASSSTRTAFKFHGTIPLSQINSDVTASAIRGWESGGRHNFGEAVSTPRRSATRPRKTATPRFVTNRIDRRTWTCVRSELSFAASPSRRVVSGGGSLETLVFSLWLGRGRSINTVDSEGEGAAPLRLRLLSLWLGCGRVRARAWLRIFTKLVLSAKIRTTQKFLNKKIKIARYRA
jgi:hypothetical protein